MKHQTYSVFALAAVTALTLACSQAAPPPTSPAGAAPVETGAGPDGSTLKASAPVPLSPVGGVEISDLDPDLVITNASPTFVSDLPLAYVFEVFGDKGNLAYRSNPIPAGASGRTTHEIVGDLRQNEVHTWRAYAVYQGQRGPMSGTASFKTFDRFGVPCSGSEQAIVACRKAQYGFIPHGLLHEFLERVAHDLNRGGHEHAPYGRLVKTVGNNCHGYSCDIICSGQGNGQRQWDVLIDEDALQGPVWNRVAQITPRHCEFVLD